MSSRPGLFRVAPYVCVHHDITAFGALPQGKLGNWIRRWPAIKQIDDAGKRAMEKWCDNLRFPGPCLLTTCALQVGANIAYQNPLQYQIAEFPACDVHCLFGTIGRMWLYEAQMLPPFHVLSDVCARLFMT